MPGCRAEYAVSWGKEFLSTPSARRATKRLEGLTSIQKISIHALREEGDLQYPKLDDPELIFLSTPSVRRATLRTARRPVVLVISIHALREEGDPRLQRCCFRMEPFLSTPSARRATLPLNP